MHNHANNIQTSFAAGFLKSAQASGLNEQAFKNIIKKAVAWEGMTESQARAMQSALNGSQSAHYADSLYDNSKDLLAKRDRHVTQPPGMHQALTGAAYAAPGALGGAALATGLGALLTRGKSLGGLAPGLAHSSHPFVAKLAPHAAYLAQKVPGASRATHHLGGVGRYLEHNAVLDPTKFNAVAAGAGAGVGGGAGAVYGAHKAREQDEAYRMLQDPQVLQGVINSMRAERDLLRG